MKPDNEAVVSIRSPPRKSCNPFDYVDEDTNAIVKSNIHVYDIKKPLAFHLDTGNLSWEEVFSHPPIETIAKSADANGEALFRKDTEIFTDKTIAQGDLPELVVLYKESADQSVKDIGIDEAVHLRKAASFHDSTEASLGDGRIDCGGLAKHHTVIPCLADGSVNVDEYKYEFNSIWPSTGQKNTSITAYGLSKTNEQKYYIEKVSGKKQEEKEKAWQNEAVEKLPETQNLSAEMSFSASINLMAPNTRCGSISLRSESSAGSTHSFAFPVIQGEWNSSPARMAKANTNQRHLHNHKHQGWFHSLVCCKF